MTVQEVRKKWVEALRSGKYKQGKKRLARVWLNEPDVCKYCCLGVLCEVMGLEKKEHLTSDNSTVYTYPNERGEYTFGYSVTPPGNISRAADIYENDLINTLIDLNDDKNYTFEQIADYIESLDKETTNVDSKED